MYRILLINLYWVIRLNDIICVNNKFFYVQNNNNVTLGYRDFSHQIITILFK